MSVLAWVVGVVVRKGKYELTRSHLVLGRWLREIENVDLGHYSFFFTGISPPRRTVDKSTPTGRWDRTSGKV
jgi:hypothetical protein